jgi:shikimate kinase/3-dehydroquinate synthase
MSGGRIILAGFMGTGKSEVGRRLAAAVGRPFVDTDDLVVADAGRPIAAIFADEGEAGFRVRERAAVARACALPEAVIAVGGGALTDAESRRLLLAAGPVVCLTATPEDVLARIGDASSRPLLAGARDRAERLARIRELQAARAPLYALATHTVDTSGLAPDAVVARVRAAVERSRSMTSVVEIPVPLGARSYPIVVGEGVLAELGARMAALGFGGRCVLVTNDRVDALHGAAARAALAAAGFEPVAVVLPDGEEHKTVAALERVWDAALAAGIERRTPVVALGGGVVGDVAGFAAATLLRGLPLVQVPTTLLAMVDSAIGGKTGVNHAVGKNLIGAFHQPRLVLADVGVLRTLPRRELVAGLAEVVKYGAIADAALFADLEARLDALVAGDPAALTAAVAAAARQKAGVVGRDEREETGERATLNFGHTVGHALEVCTGYGRWLHGEAVAIGMVAAARVSRALGHCDDAAVERLRALLVRAGLPVTLPPDVDRDALARAMRGDKKSAGGRIAFVALETIGRVRLVPLESTTIARHL